MDADAVSELSWEEPPLFVPEGEFQPKQARTIFSAKFEAYVQGASGPCRAVGHVAFDPPLTLGVGETLTLKIQDIEL